MKRKPVKIPRERNQFVAAAKFRVAGPHGKTRKAERRGNKMSLQKQMDR